MRSPSRVGPRKSPGRLSAPRSKKLSAHPSAGGPYRPSRKAPAGAGLSASPRGRYPLGVVVRTEEMRRALDEAAQGSSSAERGLFELLYEDLMDLARQRRSALGKNESLRTTDLVHESWLRLYGTQTPRWENRRHFFGAAANAMRNILVDRARRRSALKREDARNEELPEGGFDGLPELVTDEQVTDVLSLHIQLEELEGLHPRPAQVVSLRLFAGLAMQEIAEVLQISLASTERDWRFGRAWLQKNMESE